MKRQLEARDREVILVCGKTGQGKTTWAIQAIDSMWDRVLVLDPMEQYDVQYMAFKDIAKTLESPVPSFKIGCNDTNTFIGMCKLAYAVGDCCLLIEEIDLYDQTAEAYSNLVFRGRHRSVSLLIVTQRPYRVHINLRSQISQLVAFQQTEPNDLKWLKDISDSAILVRDLKKDRDNGISYFYQWDSEGEPSIKSITLGDNPKIETINVSVDNITGQHRDNKLQKYIDGRANRIPF